MLGALVGTVLSLLPAPVQLPVISPIGNVQNVRVLSSHDFPLSDRYNNSFVNEVFTKNILLTLAYIRQSATPGQSVDWKTVEAPFTYAVTLEPQKVLTYHDEVLPKYENVAVPLTTVHFNSAEGFISDGYLVGDGTCHLASLLAWAAKDAGLDVEAPSNHNFATIPDVPKEDGVSIFVNPLESSTSAKHNLYIENNQNHPVTFAFSYDGSTVEVKVTD